MYTNIIGTQQILITAAFLGVMILLLIILQEKKHGDSCQHESRKTYKCC